MTTSTTVFGMLPMLIITAEVGKKQIWNSLAICTAGGLVSSTLFIFFVIPIFYYHGDRMRGWAAAKARDLARPKTPKKPAEAAGVLEKYD